MRFSCNDSGSCYVLLLTDRSYGIKLHKPGYYKMWLLIQFDWWHHIRYLFGFLLQKINMKLISIFYFSYIITLARLIHTVICSLVFLFSLFYRIWLYIFTTLYFSFLLLKGIWVFLFFNFMENKIVNILLHVPWCKNIPEFL